MIIISVLGKAVPNSFQTPNQTEGVIYGFWRSEQSNKGKIKSEVTLLTEAHERLDRVGVGV